MTEPDRDTLLAAETHLLPQMPQGRGRAVVVFPNTYEPGMSSLSVQTLYSLLNQHGVACERGFMPPNHPLGEVRSLESQALLSSFDTVLVTSSFELDWLNIPAMLTAGGVPPLREERDDQHPLVIIGGPAVTANPEPLADFADALWIGELEPFAGALADICLLPEGRQAKLDRLRAEAARVCGDAGLYLPWLPEHEPALGADRRQVGRLYAPDLSVFSTESAILTPYTTFADRFLIEISRGCARGCSFCLARRIYRPWRIRPADMLVNRIGRVMDKTPRVGLVSTAVSDYPEGETLWAALSEMGAEVSVSSVRAETASAGLLTLLGKSGQHQLTLAPEAGTEALRRRVGKPMSDEELFDCVERGVAAGIHRFKLYFLLGLPGETDADARAIAGLLSSLRSRARSARFSVSINPFVPKPHTAYEGEAFLTGSAFRRRIGAALSGLQRAGIHDVTSGSVRWSEAQTILSRGGRELCRPILEASLAGADFGGFKAAVRAAGIDWKACLGPIETHIETAPWKVVADEGCAP